MRASVSCESVSSPLPSRASGVKRVSRSSIERRPHTPHALVVIVPRRANGPSAPSPGGTTPGASVTSIVLSRPSSPVRPQGAIAETSPALADDALREEEAQHELAIMPRRAHRDRQRVAGDADLERLLDDDLVVAGARASPRRARAARRRPVEPGSSCSRSVEGVLAEALRVRERGACTPGTMRTSTAVTLYSGQLVSGLALPLVSRFVFTSGKWNERKTLPGATRVVTHACVCTLPRALSISTRSPSVDAEALGVRRVDLDEIRRLELDVAGAPRLRARVVVRELAAGDEDEREVARSRSRRAAPSRPRRGSRARSACAKRSSIEDRRARVLRVAAPATAGPASRGARARSPSSAA